jgi:hypothetical protein
MSEPTGKCEICGEPMPAGEEMFKYHGYSGDCPKPPLPRPVKLTCEQLEAQLAAANEKVLRVVRGDFTQICSHCGWEAQASGASWDELQAHIKECPEHPIRALNEKIVAQQARIAELHSYLRNLHMMHDYGFKDTEIEVAAIIDKPDDLSALSAHDKQVKKEALEALANQFDMSEDYWICIDDNGETEKEIASELRRMAANLTKGD